jgi:serine/threonine-protein kinase
LELAPDLPEAHLALAYYYQRLPDLDRALQELAITEEGIPGDAAVLSRKAGIFWRMERWQEAVDLKYREVALDPRDPGGMRTLGRWLKVLRRYDQAEQYLTQSLTLQPDNVAAEFDLASVHWARDGNPEPYRRWSTRQDLPYVPWVGTLRWLSLFYARDFHGALDVLRTMDVEFERWNPYFPRPLLEGFTHRLMGASELAVGAFEAARWSLEQRIQNQPSDPAVHRALGVAYAGLGMNERAVQEALVVGELLPGFQVPSGYIGFEDWGFVWIYSLLGDHGRAIDHLDLLMASPVGPSVNEVSANPLVDDLHQHPRFQALLEKHREG